MLVFLTGLLIVSGAVELLLLTSLGWKLRQLLAVLAVLLFSTATGGLLAFRPGLGTIVIFLVCCYRLFNMLRLAKARIIESYLQRVTRRTSVWLVGGQLVILGLSFVVWNVWHVTTNGWLLLMAAAQFAVAALLLWHASRHLRKLALVRHKRRTINDHELPSVTVAVPARNESEELEACLQSILASDYPKLEVIALDDCSHDRTPEIIRGYAHAGVRFIPGSEPTESWLAKNNAYRLLAENASGELILFCGVDVRFAPQSLRQLVSALTRKRKSMLSVLPLNTAPQRLPFVQSMRYYWELVPPRRLFQRPPVLSSCWLITRQGLDDAGGFAAVSRSISPEAYFAKAALKFDGYSFGRSDEHLGITSVKDVREQTATAVRTRYPQLHRRPELVLLVSAAELFFLVGPLIVALASFWVQDGLVVQALAVAAFVLQVVLYAMLERKLFIRRQLLPVVAFPLAVLGDVLLLNFSMYKYEFSKVYWKGRNIYLPIMRAIPHLPELK